MSSEKAARGPLSFMIIDDDEISLSLISLLLKAEGHSVIEASGGQSALETLASLSPEAHPEVLIADLRMPGLSGTALATELRRSAPQAKLFAMSATFDAALGYDGFLRKPFDAATLGAVLNGVVPRFEPARAADDQFVLNEAVYQQMSRMMPPAALREVYEAFLNDSGVREQEMRTAAAANDLVSVRRIAHALKGSAGMVGARKLASAAAELELGVYGPKQVSALIDNLLSCCDELHRILLGKLP